MTDDRQDPNFPASSHDRDGQHSGSARSQNGPQDRGDVPAFPPDQLSNGGIPGGPGVSEHTLIQALIPLIHQEFKQYYPDPDTASELKSKAPEVYNAWISTTKSSIETENYVRKATVDNAAAIAKRGQIIGFLSVVLVLLLAAYCAYLDRPWLAGFLVAIDVVALAAVFAPRNESAPEEGNSSLPVERG